MIFILGGKGFVGSGFARACEMGGRKFAVIDRENYADFAGGKCDLLINAAGNSRKFYSREAPVQDFDASVRSVRSSLVDFQFRQYVLISSADVYPDSSSPGTTTEDQELDVTRQSPYGFHKHLAELCVRHCAPEWLIVRGGGFVGPFLKKNPIYDILHGGPLWLDRESELQYIHTDQAAKIALALLDQGISRQIFNICGAGVVRLEEVMRWAGGEVPVKPGSPKFRCEMDIAKVSARIRIPETSSVVRDFVISERRVTP